MSLTRVVGARSGEVLGGVVMIRCGTNDSLQILMHSIYTHIQNQQGDIVRLPVYHTIAMTR